MLKYKNKLWLHTLDDGSSPAAACSNLVVIKNKSLSNLNYGPDRHFTADLFTGRACLLLNDTL